MDEIKVGSTYRHFRRGTTYEVIGIARHSETDEPLVVYKALYADPEFPLGQLWARPLAMFTEEVASENENVPRFSLL